jgi:hypothetical protein
MSAAALITTAFAALSVATLTSCSRPPTAPGAAVPPVTTRVELIAPRTLAPGATVQLRVIAHRSDGSTQDITATANFYSQPSGVLAISSDGTATALKLGDAFVTGQSATSASTREVIVVPDGTFRVVGRVVEEDTLALPVGDVRVEAEGGVPLASTDLGGLYRLYGVPGQARIRVSKSGYITKELTLAISDHHTENVALAVAGPRVDAGGTYQLTIEASPDCHGQIPEALLRRRYSAGITQSGSTIRGTLSSANFAIGRFGGRSNFFSGRVEQTGGVLEFNYYGAYDEDPSLVEIIDDTTRLVIEGQARISAAGPSFHGTLGGSFIVFAGDAQGGTPSVAACRSPSHRVALTR